MREPDRYHPGLVAMAGDSTPRGPGFESQRKMGPRLSAVY